MALRLQMPIGIFFGIINYIFNFSMNNSKREDLSPRVGSIRIKRTEVLLREKFIFANKKKLILLWRKAFLGKRT